MRKESPRVHVIGLRFKEEDLARLEFVAKANETWNGHRNRSEVLRRILRKTYALERTRLENDAGKGYSSEA